MLEESLVRDSALAVDYKLLQQFREVVGSRDIEKLDLWLSDAKSTSLPTFAALATGLKAERMAVENGLALPWSNGLTEGVVTKVKLISRLGNGSTNGLARAARRCRVCRQGASATSLAWQSSPPRPLALAQSGKA